MHTQMGAIAVVGLPASARQRWSAAAVATLVLVGFASLSPFVDVPLAELNAFIPSMDAIIIVTDLITSVLLFAQFSIFPSRSILILASGYLFTALMVIPHALTLAGAFSPTGLFGPGLQTRAWLYIFWHIGFAAALLGYGVLKEQKPISRASPFPAIGWTVTSVIVLAGVLSWGAITENVFLLPVILDNTRTSRPVVFYPFALTILVLAIALVTIWARRRSVLDLWLIVVALVSIGDLAFTGLLTSVRFSLGVYAGRAFSLATSSLVLIILLAETTGLYVRLARSNVLLKREQENKLMSIEAVTASIAHEIRQPLASIAANAGAAKLLIGMTPPDHEEAQAALAEISDSTDRASKILDSVRDLFRSVPQQEQPVDVNALTLDSLRVLRRELDDRSIEISTDFVPALPPIMGHWGQLQQVILNLVRNSIEAMESMQDRSRVLKISTELYDSETVAVSVADTGPGIAPEKMAAIFDVFVTTKPNGMGLGLPLCKMIVERHRGNLFLSSQPSLGTRVQIMLPITIGMP